MSPTARYLSTTLALVAVAVGATVWAGWGERPRPRLERPVGVATRPTLPPPIPPSARAILDRRAELSLTPGQSARLEALDRKWTEESSRLRAALDAAQKDLSRFMEARSARGAAVGEIQRRSEEYRELSVELRERRRRHADLSLDVLQDGQRARMTRERPPSVRSGGDR